MKLIEIKHYGGKNVYCFQPVIKGLLDLGEWTGRYSDELGEFADNLVKLLPGVGAHHCSRGYPGGFVERLREGTYIGHVVEHTAIELLNMAGYQVNYGKTLSTQERNVYEVIIECANQEAGSTALCEAVELVDGVLRGKAVCPDRAVETIRRKGWNNAFGPSTRAIIAAAEKRKIPVTYISNKSLVQLGYGRYLKRIQASLTDRSSSVAVDIAGDKELTKDLLLEAGLPVPLGRVAITLREAKQIAGELGFPVVVKPVDGNHGRGVTVDIHSIEELAPALKLAQAHSQKVIVEKSISGLQYRALVIGGRLVAVAERFSPFVVGDGKRNIAQLTQEINDHPWRGQGHELPLTKISMDEQTIKCLAKQGLSLDSIPEEGAKIILRENSNLSTGGVAVDVTEQVCPENKAIIERAVRLIGLDVAGVDLIAQNINHPIREGTGVIIEINAAPGLRMHCFPVQGQAKPVGEAIVDWLFPQGTPYRVPIISITGTNGKTTTARMIDHILRISGKVVGLTTSDGIYIDGQQVMAGDTTGPRSAQVVLRDSAVEIAVLETARGGILRAGLGYNESDIAVITNIASDHLGQDGIESLEDLAHVKALVGEVVPPDGYIVINADDPLSISMVDRFLGKVIYFTRVWNNPIVRRHLGTGGRAVIEKSGEIIFAKGEKSTTVVQVRKIPATFNGKAGHNIENALAAVGVGIAMGIKPSAIAKALSSFGCNLHQNPGRMNIIPIGDIRVVLDYGHNPEGFKRVLETLKKLHPGRITGVVGMPGDRRDADLTAAGAVLAQGLDRLIVKEDIDLRGREAGVVASIMRDGALAAGFNKELIKVIPDEAQAVAQALREAQPGEMVVVFYEKLTRVLPVVEEALRNHQLPRANPTHQKFDEVVASVQS